MRWVDPGTWFVICMLAGAGGGLLNRGDSYGEAAILFGECAVILWLWRAIDLRKFRRRSKRER